MDEERRNNLRRLLSPRHVAFVGGQGVAEAIRQCVASGFTGPIWPVHPAYAELGGRPCFPSLAHLPEAPDATFIAVPREATIGVVRELAMMGAGGCVCYAAGFAETGDYGTKLQQELVQAAGDLALVGPNCYGLLNHIQGVALWPSGFGGQRVERGAALIAQSGNIALNLSMNQRSVPFAYVVSSGNEAVLRLEDYLEVFTEDPHVAAIGLYIEGFADVSAFSQVAVKAASRGIPIVAFKAGRSSLGARLAVSHTSSLAGDDRLCSALFERLGIIRADSLPALLETLKFFVVSGTLASERLAVFTCSGGDSLMIADLAERSGLVLPQFAPAQATALRALLPNFASVSNPLDYSTTLWGNRSALCQCFKTALEGDFNAGLLVIDYPEGDEAGQRACDAAVDALTQAHEETGKLVTVASTLPELMPEPVRRRLISQGITPLQGIADAIGAISGSAGYRRWRSALIGDGAALLLPPLTGSTQGAHLLGEFEAKRRLAAFGLSIPEGRLACPDEAPAVAAELGFPVVAKVALPELTHKTDAGAVRLNLQSEADVQRAVAEMRAALSQHRPGLVADRFLIERQVTGALAEMIVGARRDDQFGLALMIGTGGILAEMLEDIVAVLLPTNPPEIERAIGKLRLARILTGYRGRPPADLDALNRATWSIVQFAEAHRDRLVELDVNPLLVLARGQGVVAADALIVMGMDS